MSASRSVRALLDARAAIETAERDVESANARLTEAKTAMLDLERRIAREYVTPDRPIRVIAHQGQALVIRYRGGTHATVDVVTIEGTERA